jgi:hypothetical protein
MNPHLESRHRPCAERLSPPARAALVMSIVTMLAAFPAAATMYKWVDGNGKTVYSDQPPPGNVKSEVIKPPPPPSNPNAVKDLVNAETEMKQREKQKAESAKEAQKKETDAAKKQDLCNTVQAQLRTLQRDDLYRTNEKGERIYLDADMRRQETETQQRILRENCMN